MTANEMLASGFTLYDGRSLRAPIERVIEDWLPRGHCPFCHQVMDDTGCRFIRDVLSTRPMRVVEMHCTSVDKLLALHLPDIIDVRHYVNVQSR